MKKMNLGHAALGAVRFAIDLNLRNQRRYEIDRTWYGIGTQNFQSCILESRQDPFANGPDLDAACHCGQRCKGMIGNDVVERANHPLVRAEDDGADRSM